MSSAKRLTCFVVITTTCTLSLSYLLFNEILSSLPSRAAIRTRLVAVDRIALRLQQHLTKRSSTAPPRIRIIYGEVFDCSSWKNASYINVTEFEECTIQPGDFDFWPLKGLRHTAHKHLLNSSSLIVEVGGNRAHDTVKFIELHDPWIISYEPLVSMANSLKEQFKSNPKVQIYPYGLGNVARKVLVEPNVVDNATTSIYRPLTSPNSSTIVQIELLNVVEVVEQVRRTRTKDGVIDMISINCEGCEFEIIPALIANELTQYFRVIQFASHINLVNCSSCIYCQMQQALQRTHRHLFHFQKLWEAWVLKNRTDN